MIKTIALATALTIAAASAAVAAKNGGYRELGPGGKASAGVNPAAHRSLGGNKADMIMSDNGRCWGRNKSMIGGWTDCPRH